MKHSNSSHQIVPHGLLNSVSIAPMMDWTDRHCRYFHRLITKQALLYTEMVTTGALIHGDVARHLRFNEQEHPVALQLGGSEAADLAQCAKLAQTWGYDEINLNCGCPSERVQRGAFGACLMAEPALVADAVRAMCDAVSIPVTVKHRIGIDKIERYDFVRDFVGAVADAGCNTFIVHARNAWLKGLSPKENREIPPLRYEMVYRLKVDFPALKIVLNGGVKTNAEIAEHLRHVDGVMLGREAYHRPWFMADWDAEFLATHERLESPLALGNAQSRGVEIAEAQAASASIVMASPVAKPPVVLVSSREQVEAQMVRYMGQQQREHAVHWWSVARHMLGLYHGQAGARRWRQVWSDHKLKHLPATEVAELAQQARLGPSVDGC
jgi:tRNA-dihydrouridine synthase A